MPALPPQVVIQGGGYIAVEFAGIFAGLGSRRDASIYRGDNILRGFDDEVRAHLRMDMEKHGITVITGCKVAAIEETSSRYSVRLSSGYDISADCVMFATGRAPNIGKLGSRRPASPLPRTAASRSTNIRAPALKASTPSAT